MLLLKLIASRLSIYRLTLSVLLPLGYNTGINTRCHACELTLSTRSLGGGREVGEASALRWIAQASGELVCCCLLTVTGDSRYDRRWRPSLQAATGDLRHSPSSGEHLQGCCVHPSSLSATHSVARTPGASEGDQKLSQVRNGGNERLACLRCWSYSVEVACYSFIHCVVEGVDPHGTSSLYEIEGAELMVKIPTSHVMKIEGDFRSTFEFTRPRKA